MLDSGLLEKSKTLVIFTAQDRELKINLELLERNLLSPFQADIALCGVASSDSQGIVFARMWSRREPPSWREAMGDLGISEQQIDRMRALGPEFFAGVEESDRGSAAIVFYWRHQLALALRDELDTMDYEWFVVTRSDMRWITPFPRIENFRSDRIYFLDGEHYGGISDRFCMFHRSIAREVLSIYSPLFLEPDKTLIDIRGSALVRSRKFKKFNAEFYQKFELVRRGLYRRVRFIPYLGFAIRSQNSTSRWSYGEFDPNQAFFVKYPSERRQAKIYSKWIGASSDWGRFPRNLFVPRVILARSDWALKKMRRRLRMVKTALQPH